MNFLGILKEKVLRYTNHVKHYFTYSKIFKIHSIENIDESECNKKIIVFTLYGSDPIYLMGAIKNIEQAKIFYTDWKLRFYIAKDIPSETKLALLSYNAEVITMNSVGKDHRYMLWRFLAASDPKVDVMISRDCDSRFTKRERNAVDEWIISAYSFHIIRDHPYHFTRILGGMWGVKKGELAEMGRLIKAYKKRNDKKGMDQLFLEEVIYPLVRYNAMIHDSQYFYNDEIVTNFMIARQGNQFIGETINNDY